MAMGAAVVWLAYAPVRVSCPDCGVCTEQVPWARHRSRFTLGLEELVAYLAQQMDKTAITRLLGISWRTVGTIIRRIVDERLDDARFEGLRVIGADEFSYRKRHRYLTVVVDHEQHRVVWVSCGRGADSLQGLFERLGPSGRDLIETVTIDMAGGYIKAVEENLPNAEIVFDRFHVQQLASKAVDEVRRDEARALGDSEAARVIKGGRYALLKSPWNMTREQKQQLSDIQQNNARLYRARLLNDTLADALNYRQPKRALQALNEWLAWASRSKLKPFVKLARTIRKSKERILAYINERYTNAIVEGMNNRIRVIARRAYGFHSAEALESMILLCLGGTKLDPPIPTH
jgi:transposase